MYLATARHTPTQMIPTVYLATARHTPTQIIPNVLSYGMPYPYSDDP